MIKGFRDFIMRGNVLDLAIAVVIGVAFAAVVSVFVSALVKPIINAFPGASVNGWGFHLRGGDLAGPTFIDVSSIINAIIVFLVTAAVVYFLVVVPVTKLQERRARGMAPEPDAVPEEILLLRQIRDALGARPMDGTAGPTPQHPLD
ncbi:MAG: large conductance mechanosensitive channel protein MscL [Jatrophihabitantaceae bacterium]